MLLGHPLSSLLIKNTTIIVITIIVMIVKITAIIKSWCIPMVTMNDHNGHSNIRVALLEAMSAMAPHGA